MASKARAWVAWATVCVVWGTTYAAIRVALETIPPLLMAGARWTIAGLLLVAIQKLRGERLPTIRAWGALAVLGVLLPGIGNGGVTWAEQMVPSGLAAVAVGTAPLWMVGLDALMPSGERLTARHVVGLAVGFAGVAILSWPGHGSAGDAAATVRGIAWAQFACAGWAVGTIYARRHALDASVLTKAAFEMVFGGLALLALGSIGGEWTRLAVNPRTAGALGYLVVVGSLVGYSAFAYALNHLPIATVSLYAYVNPLIAVALGTLILGEPFTQRTAAAAATVLGGMWLVRGK